MAVTNSTLRQAALVDSGPHGPGPEPLSCLLRATASPPEPHVGVSCGAEEGVCPCRQGGRCGLGQGKPVLLARTVLVAERVLGMKDLLVNPRTAEREGCCCPTPPAALFTKLCGWLQERRVYCTDEGWPMGCKGRRQSSARCLGPGQRRPLLAALELHSLLAFPWASFLGTRLLPTVEHQGSVRLPVSPTHSASRVPVPTSEPRFCLH